MHQAITFLKNLSDIKPVYLLIGNHDLINNRQFLSDMHPFTALKHYWPITVVDKPIIATHNNMDFLFVPYVEPGRFVEAIETRYTKEEWTKCKLIFCHQEFYGTQMGAITSEDGDKWNLNWPQVIAGHIHARQIPQANILYTGSPDQESYGEADNKKVSLFEVEYGVDGMKETLFDLGLKKKVLIHVNFEDIESVELRNDVFMKIVVNCSPGQMSAVMKHPNVVSWKKLGYKVLTKVIDNAKMSMGYLGENGEDDDCCEDGKGFERGKYKKIMKFSDLLYDCVKDDKDLELCYRECFGGR